MNAITGAISSHSITNGTQLIAHLDARIDLILADIERSAVWDAVMGEQSQSLFIREVLKEIYLEIYMYQQDSVEAAITSIGQFPRNMPVALVANMLQHQTEEFDHGEMALRDYVALGGIEEDARRRRKSPTAFAVAAVWSMIAIKRDPFAYLGAVYLFEALTPIITNRVKAQMLARLGGARGLEFVVHHASADVEHAAEIKHLIEEIVEIFPNEIEGIVSGFDYFAQVYPLPGWLAALDRAETPGSLAQAAE